MEKEGEEEYPTAMVELWSYGGDAAKGASGVRELNDGFSEAETLNI